MERVPERFHDLFEKQTFAHVATMLPNGLPHVTPVWVGYDADTGHLEFNTARGRRKERNLSADPRVGLSMTDPDDPYRYVAAWGEVDELTEAGAVEHIDALARRYMDVDEYPHHGEEEGERVLVRVAPERVVTSGR